MEVIPEELLEQAAVDEEHRRIINEVGLRSYVCVPLRTREHVIGALTLIYAESGRSYDKAFLALAEEFGRRAGLAVEKARLFQDSELRRAELRRSNEAKDQFLGMIAHELRTPITTILGTALLLGRSSDRIKPDDAKELLQGIADETRRMHSLMEDLLILARLELTEVQLDVVSISQSVHEVAESVPDRVITVGGDPDVAALADSTLLRQVLVNLISNADKYSPKDQPIDLVARSLRDRIEITVSDRGPGVSTEELNLIFESFYRAESAISLPGKGLGLSICKRMVEAMGGGIDAIARPGGGLTVRFWLQPANIPRSRSCSAFR